MTTVSGRNNLKLNSLFREWRSGTVGTQRWLDSRGIYRQLADRYVRSGWLERLGAGAYRRAGDVVDWRGAVFALQVHDKLNIHPGGRTALELLGYEHFIQARQVVWLFGPPYTRLPSWFSRHDWQVDVRYRTTSLFSDSTLGLTEKELDRVPVRLSTSERAMLEVLNDVPRATTVSHASALMRGLTTARPALVQKLLEACSSVKAKRLFLLLAEHEGHQWTSKLKREAFNLGRGKRVLGDGGHYYSSYQLSLPEPLGSTGGGA